MSEQQQSGQAERNPISVVEMLSVMLEQVASVSWSKLGLQPDFVTGKLEAANLDEAKLAIDVADFLATRLQEHLDEEDRRQLQNMVRDLKLNFVAKQKENS